MNSMQQGDYNQTGNPLDLTIEGAGFFQIQLPTGEVAYTRSGAFHLDSTGVIVDAQRSPAHRRPHR